MIIKIDSKDEGVRLDNKIFSILKDTLDNRLTRSVVQQYLSNGCTVNGKSSKKSYKVKSEDVLDIEMQYWEGIVRDIDLSKEILSQKGELDIRYEDANLMVIYKPKGLIVHPGVGNKDNTLANYIRYYLEEKGEYDSLMDRCGIVHRLDKGVSGLIVVAKNKNTQEYLKSQFKEKKVIKIYHAYLEESKELEHGLDLRSYVKEMNINLQPWKDWEKVEGYIGRNRRDRYKMEFEPYQFSGSKYALSYFFFSNDQVLIKIDTGRMHQIRCSLEYLGYHIKGDSLYGKSKEGDKIMLESVLLSFVKEDGDRLTLII